MKDENKGKLVKTFRPIKNQILKFWTYSQKAVKTTLPRLFHKGIHYPGAYHAEFPITKKTRDV
jgi:hypothetical protein